MPIKAKPGTKKPRRTDLVTTQRRPHANKYDWELLRRNFIEGVPVQGTKDERHYPTLKEIAEAHDVPYPRMRKHSADERWVAKRHAAQEIAAQERLRRRAKALAANAMDFDEKAFSLAKLGIAMVTTRLAEIATDVQVKKPLRDDALLRLKNGEHVRREELYSAVRSGELVELANAADRFQTIGMKALGTDVQRIAVDGNVEHTGVVTHVAAEVQRDDPERLAAMFGAMSEAGMLPQELLGMLQINSSKGGIIDVEVVDNTEGEEPEQSETPGRMPGPSGNGNGRGPQQH